LIASPTSGRVSGGGGDAKAAAAGTGASCSTGIADEFGELEEAACTDALDDIAGTSSAAGATARVAAGTRGSLACRPTAMPTSTAMANAKATPPGRSANKVGGREAEVGGAHPGGGWGTAAADKGGGASDTPANSGAVSSGGASRTNSSGKNSSASATSAWTRSSSRNSTRRGLRSLLRTIACVPEARRLAGGGGKRGGRSRLEEDMGHPDSGIPHAKGITGAAVARRGARSRSTPG
jgi:hypothetical protein